MAERLLFIGLLVVGGANAAVLFNSSDGEMLRDGVGVVGGAAYFRIASARPVERFGQSWPRRKVPTLETFPDGVNFPKYFVKEYVSARKPVVFENLVYHMTPEIDLEVEAQLESGWSAISVTQASAAGKPDSVPLSLREVMLDVSKGKETYTRHFMPAPMKTMVQVPIFMLCQEILEGLFETRQNVQFLKTNLPFPLRQEYNHQLYCQVEGEKEFLLIDDTSFPGWSAMATRETPDVGRLGPFVNMYSLDYEQAPQLKDIPFMHIANLTAGNCLFVPAGFIHQQNVLSKVDNSVEIRWRKPKDLSEADDAMCSKKVGLEAPLRDFAFPGEGVPKPPERTTDRVRKWFSVMVPLVEKYLIRENALDFGAFVELLKEDKAFIGDYPTWNEERTSVGKELFGLLDTSRDDKLSSADLEGLGKVNITSWCGHASDKMRDFEELTFDMHIDKAGYFPSSDNIDDIEEMIFLMQEYELKGEGKWVEPPPKVEKKVEKVEEKDDDDDEEETVVEIANAKDEL